jgi:hypothetical protein
VGRGLQIPIHVGDRAPTSPAADGDDQQTEVREMDPVKVPFQGPKKLFHSEGHAYDTEHGAILRLPHRRELDALVHHPSMDGLFCR